MPDWEAEAKAEVDAKANAKAEAEAASRGGGPAVGFIDAMLLRVRSRGRVAVTCADPLQCPAAEENMLSHPEDVRSNPAVAVEDDVHVAARLRA